MRFEFSTAVKIHVVTFWIMTSCSQVGGYQQNSKTFCFHLQGNGFKSISCRYGPTSVPSSLPVPATRTIPSN